jgi:hypothetical protein
VHWLTIGPVQLRQLASQLMQVWLDTLRYIPLPQLTEHTPPAVVFCKKAPLLQTVQLVEETEQSAQLIEQGWQK